MIFRDWYFYFPLIKSSQWHHFDSLVWFFSNAHIEIHTLTCTFDFSTTQYWWRSGITTCLHVNAPVCGMLLFLDYSLTDYWTLRCPFSVQCLRFRRCGVAGYHISRIRHIPVYISSNISGEYVHTSQIWGAKSISHMQFWLVPWIAQLTPSLMIRPFAE